MDETDNSGDVVVPVVAEEIHADAIPVQTGGVRVTKRVEGHDEIIEQELRKGRVDIKRVKTDRVVDGPQPVQRNGNTLIIPVVAEVLRIKKEWVVTEEIHLTQLEERETVQERVTVNQEKAYVERLDDQGRVHETVQPVIERDAEPARLRQASVLTRERPEIIDPARPATPRPSAPRSLLPNASREPKKRA